MNETQKAAFDDFRKGFGDKLSAILSWTFEDRDDQRKFVESAAERIGLKSDTIRRWMAGRNLPDLFALSQLLDEINRVSTAKYDANYLFGARPTEADKSAETAEFGKLLRSIQKDVQGIRAYVRDHELGLEAVVMRQTVRMLEDFKARYGESGALKTTEQDDQDAEHLPPGQFEPIVAGFLPDDLLEIVESCAVFVRLATLRLDYVAAPHDEFSQHAGRAQPDQNNRESVAKQRSERNGKTKRATPLEKNYFPGRLLDVVRANIDRGCHYRYILPGGKGKSVDDSSLHDVRQVRGALEHAGASGGALNSYLTFFSTDYPIGAGFVILDIEVDRLRSRRKALFKELARSYFAPTENPNLVRLGEVIPPSRRTHCCLLMDPATLEQSWAAWNRLEENSTPVLPR